MSVVFTLFLDNGDLVGRSGVSRFNHRAIRGEGLSVYSRVGTIASSSFDRIGDRGKNGGNFFTGDELNTTSCSKVRVVALRTASLFLKHNLL
jgi:hypothetical protein